MSQQIVLWVFFTDSPRLRDRTGSCARPKSLLFKIFRLRSTSPQFSDLSTPSSNPSSISSPITMSTPDEQLAQAIQAIGALVNQVSSLTATVNGMQMQLGDLQFPPPPRPITPAAPIPRHPSPAHVPLPASRPFSPYYQAPPPTRKEPKMAVPLPFSGKREETETFINSCRLYMSARPSEFYDEQAKVYWVLSFRRKGGGQPFLALCG